MLRHSVYLADYKELFEKVQNSIAVYSSDELDIDNGDNANVIIKDYLKEGKAQLDAAREALHYLCEPVALPREIEQYLHYFCGDANDRQPERPLANLAGFENSSTSSEIRQEKRPVSSLNEKATPSGDDAIC